MMALIHNNDYNIRITAKSQIFDTLQILIISIVFNVEIDILELVLAIDLDCPDIVAVPKDSIFFIEFKAVWLLILQI